MKCSNCAAEHRPRDLHRWDIRLCADGRRHRVFRVCGPCDVRLNASMLRVMGDKRAAEKIARYRASQ